MARKKIQRASVTYPFKFKGEPDLIEPKNRVEQILGSCKFLIDDEDEYARAFKLNNLNSLVVSAIVNGAIDEHQGYHMKVVRRAKLDMFDSLPINEDQPIYSHEELYGPSENVESL